MFVAATTLTSVFSTLDEPTLINSPFSNTRNKRACVPNGISPISSRKIVPPLVTSKYPLRASCAPVNDPFSCPNNSESIVPSGIEPQLMAINCPCLRGLRWWIILENDSFPLPLSPVISTDISVGATCMATFTALFSKGELPIIPNRNLRLCISASEMVISNSFSNKRRSCAIFTQYLNVLTFRNIPPWNDHNLIPAIPPLQVFSGTLRRSFGQHGEDLTDVFTVPLEGMQALFLYDLVQPSLLRVQRHIVAEFLRGRCTLTFRIGEHISKVEFHSIHEMQG